MDLQYCILENLGELDVVRVKTPLAEVTVSLWGAQVLSFIPAHDQRERLWLSPKALLDKSKPIRGGIPICWPWFGPAPAELQLAHTQLPAHGYARIRQWQISSTTMQQDGTFVIVLQPTHQPLHKTCGSLSVSLRLIINQSLLIELITHNHSEQAVDYHAALHSYFAVNDIQNAVINGVISDYQDKLHHGKMTTAPRPYRITSATDRVHLGSSPTVSISENGIETLIGSSGNDSMVIWNPWQEGCQAMSDMPIDGYQQMLCVETARTQQGSLGSQETHHLSQKIT